VQRIPYVVGVEVEVEVVVDIAETVSVFGTLQDAVCRYLKWEIEIASYPSILQRAVESLFQSQSSFSFPCRRI